MALEFSQKTNISQEIRDSKLLYERNQVMVSRLLHRTTKNDITFVVVGHEHLKPSEDAHLPVKI
ncbi:TPA: hypothetical protein JBA75_15890 [Legionella pneumophila subsp. pneumophila]|nr:hypothetical protein [Legionella pneumophila subsp. pneumophila]